MILVKYIIPACLPGMENWEIRQYIDGQCKSSERELQFCPHN